MNAVLRMPEVEQRTGQKAPTVYLRIKSGLFMPPVKLSERVSVWPSSEIEAWLAAKIRGASDDEIRNLVTNLKAQRLNAA